mmetsp:Transcript_3877/g.5122  ORF Transcript_3877/g.5122 Transcript_3877/m.5122 type:complete len:83 (+) Transcript_3877:200-448(+)
MAGDNYTTNNRNSKHKRALAIMSYSTTSKIQTNYLSSDLSFLESCKNMIGKTASIPLSSSLINTLMIASRHNPFDNFTIPSD